MKNRNFKFLCDMEPGKEKRKELRKRLRRRINGRYLTAEEKRLLFFVLRECEREDSKLQECPLWSKGIWLLNEVDYYVRPKEQAPADEAFHSLGRFLLAEIDRKVEADFELQKKKMREKLKRKIMKIIRLIRRKWPMSLSSLH